MRSIAIAPALVILASLATPALSDCKAKNTNGTASCSCSSSNCSGGKQCSCADATGGGTPTCECRRGPDVKQPIFDPTKFGSPPISPIPGRKI